MKNIKGLGVCKFTRFKFFLIMILAFMPFSVSALSLEQTIKMSAAVGSLCQAYAVAVDGDVEAFSEMNVLVLQISEKMGYTNNMRSYILEVNEIRNVLSNKLREEYGSELSIYNNYCVKFYNNFQSSLAKYSNL